MREMNCRNVRREVEEVAAGDLLSSSAINHLKNCPQCGTFHEERLKLREMLSTLGGVEAPGDFEFRLRARLANEKRGQPFVMRNLSFGFRSATVATILLLIGSALLFVSLKTQPNSSLSADATKSPSTATDQSQNDGQKESGNVANASDNLPGTSRSDVTDGKQASPETREKVNMNRSRGFRRTEVASVRGDAGSSGRPKTREMGATEARVLRQTDAMAATGSTTAFPIGASFQSLKVSLDDGRGTSRTISLPSVSFGSQRVLANGSSPLLASARSAW